MLVFCSLLLASCGSRAVVLARRDGDRQIVRVELQADPRFIDPHRAGDFPSATQCSLAYESLVQYRYPSPSEPEVVPCLAVRMPEISEDRLTYTFTLRKNVYFQDDPCFPNGIGRKMTAKDVIYSLKRIMSLSQGGFWILENKVVGLDDWRQRFLATSDPEAQARLFEEPVEGLEWIDEHTFRIHLVKPYPQLLWVLGMTYGSVVPREAVEMYGPEFTRHPVGTGPFVLKEYLKKRHLIWVKNPKYREWYFPHLDKETVEHPEFPENLRNRWENEGTLQPGEWEKYVAPHIGKRMPLADEIHFFIIPEASTSFLEFLAGTIDRQKRLTKDQFENVVSVEVATDTKLPADQRLTPEIRGKGIHLQVFDEPWITYIAFNMEDEIVGGYSDRQKKLRKAISLAMDREYFIAAYANGRGRVANMVIPPGVKGYDPNYWPPCGRFNPVQALDLLREAGYDVFRSPSGEWITRESPDSEPMELTIEFRSPRQKDVARFYAICLRDIGIRLKANLQTFPEFLRRAAEGKGQLYDASWVMDYPDAQNVLQLLYGPNRRPGVNYAAYQNDRYDELYEEMQVLSDNDPEEWKRKSEIIEEMIRIVDEDTPWVYIFFYQSYILFHDWFAENKPNPMDTRDHTYFTSDPHLRLKQVKEFNAIYWPPAIVFVSVIVLIIIAFVLKIVQQQRG